MLSRIKDKLGLKRPEGRRLTDAFRPSEDPLRPIELDLAAILKDVQSVAIDKPDGAKGR